MLQLEDTQSNTTDSGSDTSSNIDVTEDYNNYNNNKNNSVGFYLILVAFWFGYNFVSASLTSIVWPTQIEYIVGKDLKELYNGIIPALAALASLFVTPVFGLLSDKSTSSFGKRRPYVAVGTLIGAVSLLLCAAVNFNIWVFAAVLLVHKCAIDAAGGPYAGLMPDVVQPRFIGKASGYLSFANAFGNLIGIVGSGVLIFGGNFWPVYIFLTGALVITTIITLVGIKELPAPRENSYENKTTIVGTIKEILLAFHLPWKTYKNLYWVLLSRFLEEMGVSAFLPFMLYFIQDILKLDNPPLWTAINVACTMLAGIPSSIYAGHLSDRIGRKIIIYISVTTMAAANGVLIWMTFSPSVFGLLGASLIFGVAYGAYRAVDWALALDVIPSGAQIAKDMGIWHVALVLPRVIAPLISGIVLDKYEHQKEMGYLFVYSFSIFWMLLSTVFVKFIRPEAKEEIPKQSEATPIFAEVPNSP